VLSTLVDIYLLTGMAELLDLVRNIDSNIEGWATHMSDISASLDALLAEVSTEIDQVTAELRAQVEQLTGENVELSAENAELARKLGEAADALEQAKAKIDAKTEELRANNPPTDGGGDGGTVDPNEPHPDHTLPGDLPADQPTDQPPSAGRRGRR